jgi:hypothetical protein
MSCDTWCWIAEALSFCSRFSPREETNALAITSIESFSGWTKTLTDARFCAAIVDRLTFAGNFIEPEPSPIGWLTPARSARRPANVCG